MFIKFKPLLVFSPDEPPSGGSSVLETSVSDLGNTSADFLDSENGSEEPEISDEDIDDAPEDHPEEDEDDDSDFSGREDEAWDDFPEDDDDSSYVTPSQPESWPMNPREQAYYEAQALGQSADWAENRAFEIYEERQAINTLQANAPLHVPVLADHFEKSGIPGGAAAPYYENLVKLTKQGFRGAAQDPEAQRVALANAIGEYVIREQQAGRTPFQGDAKKTFVTPTGGNSTRTGAGKLSRQDQRFINQWQATHNGGKPPSSKQLAALQAEGLIG